MSTTTGVRRVGGCPWVKRFSVFQVSFAAGTAMGRRIYYLHLLELNKTYEGDRKKRVDAL